MCDFIALTRCCKLISFLHLMLKNYAVIIKHCAYLTYMFTSDYYLFTNLCIMKMNYLSLSLIISL